MTEEEIERKVEKTIDKLDKRYLSGEITREQYESEMVLISRWAEEQYKKP